MEAAFERLFKLYDRESDSSESALGSSALKAAAEKIRLAEGQTRSCSGCGVGPYPHGTECPADAWRRYYATVDERLAYFRKRYSEMDWLIPNGAARDYVQDLFAAYDRATQQVEDMVSMHSLPELLADIERIGCLTGIKRRPEETIAAWLERAVSASRFPVASWRLGACMLLRSAGHHAAADHLDEALRAEEVDSSDSAPFEPNWTIPPGATVRDVMNMRGLESSAAARDLSLTPYDFDGLLVGKVRIDWPLAARLSEVFGAPEDFWMMREVQYRRDLARLAAEKDGSP